MNGIGRHAPERSWVINGRFLTQRMTGVQRYAYEIVVALNELLAQEPDRLPGGTMRLVVPPGAETIPALSKIEVRRTRLGSGHAWDQLVLPFQAERRVLSLGNFGPLLARRHIVCIHDANTFILPESYSRTFRLVYRRLLPWVGGRASRVATVSQFSADMLVKYGVCRREQIFIAPNGHEHVLRWRAERASIPVVDRLQRPYILLLGSSARHKNIGIVLAQASALDQAGIDVVIAGGSSSIFAADSAAVQQSNVHHLGFVGDDELAALYRRAMCLVFPSRTEGFGIPPLEAMALGCPVISSDAASLKEVGGDAVMYVDPDDDGGWRQAIVALSASPELRASMSEQGRQRAAQFSWKRSAEIYLSEMLRLP
ncbi:MAG: glycosyltransferase family 4 protein [Bradyrhizobium sp.]|uniref:glycosyltransferase family 4 protein n=1 Tax=Bradyrhizobium sp. TaxID=376 RepID=UPI001DBA6A51|nr:glycosyltransferase family 1 protein [Bradyrhizobium sp.]MBV9561744.1 glycosyltransferase family 4 protein [Bradyrhizobium sp.]